MRVHLATEADVAAYRRAVLASAARLKAWNPVNPGDLLYHLRAQSPTYRTFLIRALQARGNHDIVGKVNVTNVVHGRALSGALGYDSYDPYAGTGLFAEGLRLVIDIVLDPAPQGMGLHRVEASVQPGNTRSAGLLRRLGFRPRGEWPAYLWLADAHGQDAWRDHVTYGVTREQWPAPAYAVRQPARPIIILCSRPEPARRTVPLLRDLPSRNVGELPAASIGIARALAIETGVPVLRDESGRPLASRLVDAVTGAVVITCRDPRELVPDLLAAGVTAPVVADVHAITRAADLVRLALQARAAAGVDDG